MRLRRFSRTLVSGLAGLALLAGLYALAAKADWRFDATADKRHSLTEDSADILRALPGEVRAVAFYRPGEAGRDQAEDLLKLLDQASPRFSFEFVDPDRNPFRVRELDVAQTGTVVLQGADKREAVTFPDEEKLVNAALRVADARTTTVYSLTGHDELDIAPSQGRGEAGSAAALAQALTDQGVTVKALNLARQQAVPTDADALLVLGPRTDLLDHELTLLADWFAGGGRLLVALFAEQATNLDTWLGDELGLQRRVGLVLDPVSQVVVGDSLTPLAQDYAFHPATRDFALTTLFPTAAALAKHGAETPGQDPTVQALVRSSAESWLETDLQAMGRGEAAFDPGQDTPGPLWLAASYAKPLGNATARALVFADQDFLADPYVRLGGNLDLARNAVSWLAEREGLIRVSKPRAANVFLMLTPVERAALTWVPLALLPLAALAAAVLVGLGRRARNTPAYSGKAP